MRKRNVAALLLTLGLTVGGNGTVVLAAEQGIEPLAETSLEAGALEKETTVETAPKEKQKTEGTKEAVMEEQVGEQEDADETSYIRRIVSFTDYTGMRVTYDANQSLKYVYEVEDDVLVGVKCSKADVNGEEVLENVSFEGNIELKQPKTGKQYTSIAPELFQGNQNLTYVKLPAGITSVAAESFLGCTTLKGIYLPSTVNRIEDRAFEGCKDMEQISLPKALTYIGDSAFKGNVKLRVVHIKDVDSCELVVIGAYAFAGCSVLEEFCSETESALPPKLESVGEGAFEGCVNLKE